MWPREDSYVSKLSLSVLNSSPLMFYYRSPLFAEDIVNTPYYVQEDLVEDNHGDLKECF